MGLAFIPLYIKYLGVEAYGLIGIFAVLQAWFTLLDVGMTPTLNREMARFSAGAHTAESIRDLVRSLEILCVGLALTAAVSVWFGSSWLADDWLHAERMQTREVANAVAIMGVVASLRIVEGLYRGAILGLQKQVWLNVVGAFLATMRWVGAVAVLAWVAPSITAFFLWQGVASIVTLAVFAVAVYRAMPSSRRKPRFSSKEVKKVGRFAAGMLLITVLALLLTQIDKILLSAMISLEDFGYYTLAATVAGVLYQLIGPITQAFYPRLTELVTRGDMKDLVRTYHRGSQLVSIFLFPAALVMVLYGEGLLALWTGNEALAKAVSPLLALLAVGTLLNGMMYMPYMLQLAHGWPGFAARVNTVAVILLIPSLLWIVPRYGALGAAWIWVVLNSCYVLIAIQFMHRRLLPNEKWRWYGMDIGLPLLAALCVAALGSLWVSEALEGIKGLLLSIVLGVGMFSAGLFAAPIVRRDLVEAFQGRPKLS